MEAVHPLIDKRWSPRAFSNKPVEKEKIKIIFEAARRSPSCFNEQPWRFLVGIKGEGDTWEKILSILNASNQEWASTAPVLMIVVSKDKFTTIDKENRHKFYDAGQSMAYLTLQATAEGLFLHQMAGFFPEKAQSVLNIPLGFEAITAVALGYRGDPEVLSEKNKAVEIQRIIRKELNEIVLSDWEKPLLIS